MNATTPHKEPVPRPDVASQIIETKQLDIDIPSDLNSDGDLDETFVQVLRIIEAVRLTIDGLAIPDRAELSPLAAEIRRQIGQHEIAGNPQASDAIHHNYCLALMAAFRCGRELVARDDLEELQRDFSRIDDESLCEVRETLGYVSDYYGIDLNLPAEGDDEY